MKYSVWRPKLAALLGARASTHTRWWRQSGCTHKFVICFVQRLQAEYRNYVDLDAYLKWILTESAGWVCLPQRQFHIINIIWPFYLIVSFCQSLIFHIAMPTCLLNVYTHTFFRLAFFNLLPTWRTQELMAIERECARAAQANPTYQPINEE